MTVVCTHQACNADMNLQATGFNCDHLKYIIEKYIYAGNEERLQNEHEDILISVDFDYTHAGAKLLGLDLGMMLNDSTRIEVLKILEEGTDESELLLLAIQMTDPISDDLDNNLDLLRSFREGVLQSGK